MRRIFRPFLFWTLILTACSAVPASPQPVPSTVTETPVVVPTTPALNPQDCGYQWATQDLPELSKSFQASIQVLQPPARANAYAFGENCLRADGSIGGFSAMETDFNVTLQVNDLANESDLGGWIVKVMQVIQKIPQDEIVGPQAGRISMTFQSKNDQKGINFYVNQYQSLPAGLNNSQIYQTLQLPH